MGSLFNSDSRFVKLIDRLTDLFWLNVLWILCSIPIITIGASTTALYYNTLKMVRNEESYITKSFFKAFKENFIQATIIWVAVLLYMGVVFIDIRIIGAQTSYLFRAALLLLFVLTIIVFLTVLYIFPLLSKFDNTIFNTVKNALILAVSQLPYTLGLIVIHIAPFVIVYSVPYLMIAILLFGASAVAYGASGIYVKIFDKLIINDEQGE